MKFSIEEFRKIPGGYGNPDVVVTYCLKITRQDIDKILKEILIADVSYNICKQVELLICKFALQNIKENEENAISK